MDEHNYHHTTNFADQMDKSWPLMTLAKICFKNCLWKNETHEENLDVLLSKTEWCEKKIRESEEVLKLLSGDAGKSLWLDQANPEILRPQ